MALIHKSKKLMNFITGEKIQFLCNHFVGNEHDFSYNPNVGQHKNKFIHLGNNQNLNNKPLVFCYTHILSNINELVTSLKGLQNQFTLIFHNSDLAFNQKHLILFEKLPLLQHIFTQNMNVKHEKVIPLPIGLANSQWAHGNTKIHQEVYNIPIEKTKEIYFNFNKNTNKEKRNKCYNDIIKKGTKWKKNMPYKEYLIELKRHKYAICPEGNGIDTHRFWECLYLGVIPICLENKLVNYYKTIFNIIVLKDWSDLKTEDLIYDFKLTQKNMDLLDMKFISDSLNCVNSFDIVIPVGPLDKNFIYKQIEYTKKNVIGYRNIYLVVCNNNINIDNCISINENIFPFNLQYIINSLKYSVRRPGWFLQQLIKLYSGFIIPNILDKYLVIDSDTLFLTPTIFIKNNKCQYAFGSEYNKPYFQHMKELDKSFKKIFSEKSGICHHMIFEKKYIKEIFEIVENNHKDKFYNIFLNKIVYPKKIQKLSKRKQSWVSEYELYFNYIFKNHKDNVQIRKLNWDNFKGRNIDQNSISNILSDNFDYISYHICK
jgi:hypothetical protein